MTGESTKRDAVVAAAVEAIAAAGLDGFRLTDVAARAGVSVGTIQHYFASKEDLINRAFAEHEAQTLVAIRRAASGGADRSSTETHTDPWRDMTVMIDAYREWGDTHQRSRMWIALAASALTNERHARLVRSIENEWEVAFTETIDRGVTSGRFSPRLPIDEIVDVLVRLTDGYALLQVATPDDTRWRDPGDAAGRFTRLAAMCLGVGDPAQYLQRTSSATSAGGMAP